MPIFKHPPLNPLLYESSTIKGGDGNPSNLPLFKGRPGGVNVPSPLEGEGKGEGDWVK